MNRMSYQISLRYSQLITTLKNSFFSLTGSISQRLLSAVSVAIQQCWF